MKKIRNMRGRRGVVLALVFTLLACGAAQARQDGQYARAQQENALKLRQYSWKSRTEVRKGGETKSTQLHLVRYDADGAVQQTLLSGTSAQIPTRGLRGFIAKKKKEDFVELLDGLRALAKSYGAISPERMRLCCSNRPWAIIRPPVRLSLSGNHLREAAKVRVQVAPHRADNHPSVRQAVLQVSTLLPRPGRDDARARPRRRPHHCVEVGPALCVGDQQKDAAASEDERYIVSDR
jgi:hypothetical protein